MSARHVLLDRLAEMRLPAMARALEEQLGKPEIEALSFEERLSLMLDREKTERASRSFSQRLRKAKLRYSQAAIEDLDLRGERGAHRSQILDLASCRWIDQHLNVLITGKTGVGKTFLGCALAHQACREGYSVSYRRMPELFRELLMGRSDGTHAIQLQRLSCVDLLVLDDFGLHSFGDHERRDLYEILEERYGLRSTIVMSQLARDVWYQALGDPTMADAILDRLVRCAYSIDLTGESRRSKAATWGGDRP
jgi:DNA replication protein DnaC